jgi:hypothetical protein
VASRQKIDLRYYFDYYPNPYPPYEEFDVPGVDNWFSLTLDTDPDYFWAGNMYGDFYKFDLRDGTYVGPFASGAGYGAFNGLCAKVGGAPPNQPPVADPNGPYTADEGSPITLDATGSSDPENDALTYSWTSDLGGTFDDPTSPTPSATFVEGPEVYEVCVEVTDAGGLSDRQCTTATVSNLPPVCAAVTVPGDPVMVGEPVSANSSFTDPGIADTHTAQWDWGDGDITAGVIAQSAGSGQVDGSHAYNEADVYTVSLTVTDDEGDNSTPCESPMVVVYDPSAGFVTGGGWIYSEPGSYVVDPGLEGKANFGFVAKYKRGQETPDGNTEFQFHAAGMNFHSSSYDWLVVTGSDYAMFKGLGTINGGTCDAFGEDPYRFRVWAGDGDPDTFRIKIWCEEDTEETVVYDNGMDQAISSGSIVIHAKD